MRDKRRKEERAEKNDLPRVGLEPTTHDIVQYVWNVCVTYYEKAKQGY